MGAGEQCDGTDFGGALCSTYGYERGALTCTATCTLDLSACIGNYLAVPSSLAGCEPGDPTCSPDALDAAERAPQQVGADLGMNRIASWITGLAGGVALLFVIYGGFLYMSAGADEERIRAARRTIKNALFGMVIVLFSYLLVQLVLRLAFSAS